MAGTADRASRQTEDVLQAVCAGLRAGLPLKRTFRAAGIGVRTGFEWREAGWKEIDSAGADEDGALSFRARFAIAVEAALVDLMQLLVAVIFEQSQGKGKGKEAWRAAKELLAMRFPDEWSERTHVAKSQKIEVTGGIGIVYKRREMDKLTTAELQDVIDTIQNRQHQGMGGAALDAEIAKYEGVLASLYEQREGDRKWRSRTRGCHDSGRQLDATDADYVVAVPVGMAHEPKRIQAPAQAPDGAGDPVVVPGSPAAPIVCEEARPTGIGYSRDGHAINLAEYGEEDLTL